MHSAATALAFLAGACLLAIQLKHFKGTSLLDTEVRREVVKPLDVLDKALGIAAMAFFVAAAALAILES
jgi:hypothetical protein